MGSAWRSGAAPRGGQAAARLGASLAPSIGLLVVGAAAWCAVEPLRPGSPPWLRVGAGALVAACTVALLGLPAALRRSHLRRAGMGGVDAMSGAAFEQRLAALFSAMGFLVEVTGRRGDFGADLVLERAGERTVVQAKRYDRPVGIEAVQQSIGATRHYGAARAMVVTSSTCTPAARALAASNDVVLVERAELVALLAAYPLGGGPARALGLLVRQLGCGAVLLAYAAGLALRVAWRLARAPLRALWWVAAPGRRHAR